MDESYPIADAIKSLSTHNYGPNAITEDNIIKIKFLINEKFSEELNATSFDHYFSKENSVRITFQSIVENCENKIFWKLKSTNNGNGQQQKFHLLNIEEDSDGAVTEYCQSHIDHELMAGFYGILNDFRNKKKLNVQDISDKNGLNLLIIAVMRNQPEIVESLLRYDFDLDCKFKVNKINFTAIDKVWKIYSESKDEENKTNSSKIMLSLLNSNSRYPKIFNYDLASQEVKNFVNSCEEMHKFIKDNKFEAFVEKIAEFPNLCHIYNRKNVSLMSLALKENKPKFVDLLSNYGMYPGHCEAENVAEMFENFDDEQQNLIIKKRRTEAKELPKTYIFVLISKSRVSHYDRRHQERQNLITEAFEILDQHEGCRKVLKVVAACKGLKIFFDFKHDSTYYFDPTTSIYTSGATDETGVIEIGAKDLLDENKKFKVIGVLIHELCHLAVLMTYMNNFNPYQMGKSRYQRRFNRKVQKQCKRKQNFEELIQLVYDCYKPDEYNSELIVRPHHIMMHYYNNPERITECEQKYPHLFKYVKEIVEPEFDKALPDLKKLQNEQTVTYSNLKEPMRAKILHKKIMFQGQKSSLSEIIGNDQEILQLLLSDEIKNILLNKIEFKFGDICKPSLKYSYTERKFVKFDKENPFNFLKKLKNFEDITNKVKDSRIFVLAGKAGEGKTTTFEYLTKKLKQNYKNFWVSYVKLRNYKKVFDNVDLSKDLNVNEVFQIFCSILFSDFKNKNINFDANFEVRIFKKLFFAGNVILLLDGVDEICPKFNDFIIKISKLFKIETKNQLWLSTRPQHAEQLQSALNTDVYNLVEYSDTKRVELFKEVLEKNSHSVDDLTIEKFKNLFFHFYDFNNPMLITFIAELYAKGKIDLEFHSVNRFGIYEALVDEQMDKIKDKLEHDDRKYSLKFSLLFQVMALKFMFEPEQIKDLSIIRKWENEKKNWTAEKIQRFGFMTVDSDFLQTDNKNSIDFIHYSYAEFFVTQFIVESIFDEGKSDKEIEKVFNILKFLRSKRYEESFLSSSLKKNFSESTNEKNQNPGQPQATATNQNDKKIHESFKKLIEKEVEEILNEKHNSLQQSLNFWSSFLRNDIKLLRKLWKVDNEDPIIIQIMFYECEFIKCSNPFPLFLKSINNSLGDSWHKILNKNILKFNFEENFEDLEDLNVIKCRRDKDTVKYFKNFYKLINLIDETFSNVNKKRFKLFLYEILDLNNTDKFGLNPDTKLIGLVFLKCYQKILKMFPNDEKMFFLILERIIKFFAETKSFSCFAKILEDFCENDSEKIRKYLFDTKILCRISKRIQFNSREFENKIAERESFGNEFRFFMDLFLKYENSIQKIQDILKSHFDVFKMLKVMPDDFLPTFANYMKIIFNSDAEILFEFIDKSHVYFDIQILVKLEEIFLNFFDGHQDQLKAGMRKVLFRENINDYKYLKFDEDSAKNLQKIIQISQKYQNSPEEFPKNLKNWDLLATIFDSMSIDSLLLFKETIEMLFNTNRTQLIECIAFSNANASIIQSDEKFKEIQKNFTEIFQNNVENVKECVRRMILSSSNFLNILTDCLDDEAQYDRIENIFCEFLRIEELQQGLEHKNALIHGFRKFSCKTECIKKFAKFSKKIVENNSLNFDLILNLNLELLYPNNEEFLYYFEDFLEEFFDNDENLVRLSMRKVLFNKKFEHNPFLNLLMDESQMPELDILKQFYIKNKNSWEDLQELFKDNQDLLKMLGTEYFEAIEELLIQSFKSNKSQILECINNDDGFLMLENPNAFRKLLKILNEDLKIEKNKIINCIRKILFNDYKEDFNHLHLLVSSNDKDSIPIIMNYYKELKTSWEELQILFTKKSFKSSTFLNMKDGIYSIFKQFIKDVFQSDITRLRAVYEDDLDFENRYVGYKKEIRVRGYKEDFEFLIFESI